MNPLLQVKLRFEREKNPQKPGAKNFRAKHGTSVEDIDRLLESLRAVLRYYRGVPKILDKMMLDINYNDIIAKSNRVKYLFRYNGTDPNDLVVGARFSNAAEGEENHIITYYIDEDTINHAIENLEIAKRFLIDQLDGKANSINFDKKNSNLKYEAYGFSESALRGIIIECSFIDSFGVPKITAVPERETFLITFYRTELTLSTLLERLNVDQSQYYYYPYGDDTIAATKGLFDLLEEKVPYLISMISSDISQMTPEDISEKQPLEKPVIPAPRNEPVIGVIDTLFDENVYFSDWVEYTEYLDDVEKYENRKGATIHGTEVTSLIVDGPRLNPWLDDGCGRFRVRHFGVCMTKISIIRLVRKIKEIVAQNPDIHVWNLSLGTEEEVSRNFISFDAAALDEIQQERNVIFVIAGTNDNRPIHSDILRIGSPADSLNSIVVNAVRRNGKPASYTRKGNVLSFFNKPDVSYYGGDTTDRITVYSPIGEADEFGTSFAAPWISRKLCYLIDVMGLPREVAKALIIDSAAGWDYKQNTYRYQDVLGYGIVPINIEQVLSSNSEEIKFIIYGTSESYKTSNYGIPVPRDQNEYYPYIARAVLCYFPECSRRQGVDYTNRELSLNFGRIDEKGHIKDINDNVQDDDETCIDERASRKEYRKWDNTKFISRELKKRNRPGKSYGDRLWGLTVTSKDRLSTKITKGLNFGIVVTLKEIMGINRIDDFIKACTLRGMIVNRLDVQNQIEVYNANQEEITFE